MNEIDSLTSKAQAGELSEAEVTKAATLLLDESDDSIASRVHFLKILAERGETPAEIAAFASAFLERAVDPTITPADLDCPTLDVCGTGGDKLDLFNVSTTSIFILAAGGVAVVKHGNRSITSNCGSADVLEELGMPIDLPPEGFAESMRRHGLGFLFAPHYHPAFKAVVPVRKQLAEQGLRTVFNILGPLLNPVRPDYQLVGVFDEKLPKVFAEILGKLGRRVAWAAHGKTADGRGVDEISTMGPTTVWSTTLGQVDETRLTPESLGLPTARVEDLTGGDAKRNAALLTGILDGSDHGPRRDIVCANAGAGFAITGIAGSIHDGIALAAELIDQGKALKKLRALTGA
jgi:anthranilate phosphoribosyltransferase